MIGLLLRMMRISPMEFIFAGRLPRGGVGERARAQQAALEKARATGEATREALAREEATLAQREAALQRGFGAEDDAPSTPEGLAGRLRQGVAKTREKFTRGLGDIVLGRKEVNRALLEEVEELLLTADMGPVTVERLIKALEARLRRDELKDGEKLKAAIQEEVSEVLGRANPPDNLGGHSPAVILFIGVNGTGKTTTIGKLAAQYTREGKKVLLAPGDTFRAAAAEQLQGWAGRAGCDIFNASDSQQASGVIYQAVEKGMKEGYDIVLCDTAGRLHTKSNLMEELKKVKRVIGNLMPGAPHETYLVLDANTGQNAIFQAREFHDALGVTGLIITKLDGTARGGVIVGIVNEFELPVRFIGVGEGVDDLRPFDPPAFAKELFHG